MNPKQCDIANKQTEGAGLTIGLIGVGVLSYIYMSNESNYPGSGLQALVYGGSILGGVFMITTTALNLYKGAQCQ